MPNYIPTNQLKKIEVEFANILKEYLSHILNELVITLQKMKMVGQPLFIFIVHSILKGMVNALFIISMEILMLK